MSNLVMEILTILGVVIGLLGLIGIIPIIKKYREDKKKILIEPSEFFKNINSIMDFLINKNNKFSNFLVKEKINGKEKFLPSIIILKSDIDKPIKISNSLDINEDINKVNETFKDELIKNGKKIYDTPTFRLVGIDKKNKLKIGLSTYFQTLSTCDFYYYKLIDMYNTKDKFNEELINKWYSLLENITLKKDFTQISGSLGCSVLLLLNKGKKSPEYVYYIVKNTNQKNGNDDKHVVPSFMYEPTREINIDSKNKDIKEELNLKNQILREFGEELLDIKELNIEDIHDSLLFKLKNNSTLNKLSNLLDNEKAELHIIGLSLDIFRLRPEILTVVIVHEYEFYEEFMTNKKTNWEIEQLHEYNFNDEKAYNDLLIDKETPLVSPAISALVLGREFILKNNLLKK